MRLVFGCQRNFDLISRGGFASTSAVQSQFKSLHQQHSPCFLSRGLQRKVSNASVAIMSRCIYKSRPHVQFSNTLNPSESQGFLSSCLATFA